MATVARNRKTPSSDPMEKKKNLGRTQAQSGHKLETITVTVR